MAGLENYVRMLLKIDEVVKSQNIRSFVIPTKVGIQSFQLVIKPLDSRFHGNDDFLRVHQGLLQEIFKAE